MTKIWTMERLERLVSFKTGKLDSNAAEKAGVYPFFTCSRQTFRTNTYSFDGEFVLLAGNNANGIYPLKYYKGKFDAYQRTYVIRSVDTNRLLNRYLYYALRLQLERLKSISTGAATKFLTLTLLKELEVEVPNTGMQERIVGILSAYDDLIENNTRRIQILEEMAQVLYREWFVHFRFPGHEKVKLVDSAIGRIPKGWEVKNLTQVADINASSIKRGHGPKEIDYVDISSVVVGQIENIKRYTLGDAPGRARRIVKHGDIIWSSVRPNRKSYALILEPNASLIVSTGFAVVSARHVPYTYLYQALTTDEFVGYLTYRATGAAYPAVTSKDFEDARLVLPPRGLLDRFDRTVSSHLELINDLHRKNANLGRTRDLLLPKLISGEISIGSNQPY